MVKLITTAIAILTTLIMAGCGGGGSSGGGGGTSTGATISGKVRITGTTPIIKKQLIPAAADLGGLTSAGSGVEVDLVRLSNQGTVTAVLASTTTDSTGAYSFSGAGIPVPDSTLAVQVPGQSATMRAIVTGDQVDITPASEAVVEKIISGSYSLANFTTQEVLALNNVLVGLGIDVSSLDFGTAVNTVQAAAGSLLTNLVASYAGSSPSSVLQGHIYNTVSITSTLSAAPSIGLATGFGPGIFIDTTNAMADHSIESIIAPIFHNLISVSQGPSGGFTDLGGWMHLVNLNGQLIVSDPGNNGVVGAINAAATLMVYPLTDNTSGLARGLRIVTRGHAPFGGETVPAFSNAVLDNAGGTTYHLVQLGQTLSSSPSPGNAVTVTATTGDVTFNSATALGSIAGKGPYASFASNILNADNLTLDLGADAISGSINTTSLGGTIGGFFNVDLFGSLTVRDNDGVANAYLGQGNVTPSGEIFTLSQTPDDDGTQAATDGIGTHTLAVAIRHTSAPVTLTSTSGSTYNVVEYAYYLSGNQTTPDPGPPFTTPVALALDSANNRALVVDGQAVLAVDLTSGARTIISDNNPPNDVANLFSNPVALALDSTNNRALVVDGQAVLAVDLTSGARTIVSDNNPPNDVANLFSNPVALALDSTNNRALVVDGQAVLAVDLTSGARTIVSDNNPPNDVANLFSNPVALALDSTNNRALVVDGQAVLAVDLTSGARTIVSDNNPPNDVANLFSNPVALALDSTNNRALVVDGQAVLAVDLTSGARTIVSDNNPPNDVANLFSNPVALALDSTNNRALVVDGQAVLALDLASGARTIVSDSNTPPPSTTTTGSPVVDSGYKYGTLTLASDGATVSGGSLLSNDASLDASSHALIALPSATPVTVSGSITAPTGDGTTSASLAIGTNTVTGTGAVTANGEVIVLATKISDTASSADIGRGLLFLIRQP